MDNATLVPKTGETRPHLEKGWDLAKQAWAIYKKDFKAYATIGLIGGLGVYLLNVAAFIHPEDNLDNLSGFWVPYLFIAMCINVVMLLWATVALMHKASRLNETVTLAKRSPRQRENSGRFFGPGY